MLDAPMGDAPRETVFTRHDAARGLEWMRQSYGLFRRARVPWVALVLCYYIVLLVINLLPYVGGIGAMVVRPVFAVGFLAAAWNQERGARPSPRHLFQGFRSNLWVLVPLGVLIIVNIAIAMGAASLVDGGRLVGVLMNPAPEGLDADAARARVSEAFSDPRVEIGMVFGMLCALPLLLALWWAPALVVFQDARLAAALRASFRAALANWRPAVRYAIGVFIMGAIVPTLMTATLALLVPAPLNATLAAVLVLPYIAFFVATLHVSDYVSYRDVFHAGETSVSEV